MTDRELMQMALDALMRLEQDTFHPAKVFPYKPAIEALRARLAQPEPEPVAWKDKTYGNLHHQNFGNSIPLYTSQPPSKPWVGLTDEEILQTLDLVAYDTQAFDFAYRIEAKLKEKNNG